MRLFIDRLSTGSVRNPGLVAIDAVAGRMPASSRSSSERADRSKAPSHSTCLFWAVSLRFGKQLVGAAGQPGAWQKVGLQVAAL